ncbi:maleylpyruvate isomerase family mycothiol-dependent enzyme [Nocardioides sp. W3-2-3]|uniref:maleylpyruvate isomerase family mycothiol-dependent enzyme n=1 Tax=Nocardioides convexus TaxID=2712224 RepID=UPI002418233F|nr:maleylpyruvate isomerase family mycothiol-dependent enzyme [Nocardioides convexus]NGZ99848.1 maleylpyruvate isomerase family mycothiol-dependent enzyme [Nocardioides convexus]
MTTPLDAADARLLRTVDGLGDAAFAEDSLCDGWTRAHVTAHLALNAEALTGVLRGIRDGVPTTMYVDSAARDGDIDALAAEPPSAIRTRLRAACAAFGEVAGVADGLGPEVTFERTPGGRVTPAAAVPSMRRSEVEIHHADLGAGYSPADWPPAFALDLLASSAERYDGPGFHVVATDEPARWAFGSPDADAVTVSGPAAALAWWSTGRDAGSLLSSTNGSLPTLEGR